VLFILGSKTFTAPSGKQAKLIGEPAQNTVSPGRAEAQDLPISFNYSLRIGLPPLRHRPAQELINHVLIPWHDERVVVQPRISLHQPFYHSIWSLFGLPFVCLPCTLTFLTLSLSHIQQRKTVGDVHRDTKSQEQQQQQAHAGVRIRRLQRQCVQKWVSATLHHVLCAGARNSLSVRGLEASSFSLFLSSFVLSLVLVGDGVALVASRRVVVVGGGRC